MANSADSNNYSVFNQFNLDGIYLFRLDAINRQEPPKSQWTDIKSMVNELNIYEDVLSPTISADMFMVDFFNLPENYPLFGGEIVRIIFKTPSFDDEQTFDFVIYKVGNRVHSEDSTKYQSYYY